MEGQLNLKLKSDYKRIIHNIVIQLNLKCKSDYKRKIDNIVSMEVKVTGAC